MKKRIALLSSLVLMSVALFAGPAGNSGHRLFSAQSSGSPNQNNSRLLEKSGNRYAYISPEFSYFETNNPEDLNFTINWDNETSVSSISCYYGEIFPGKTYVELVENTDYLVEGNNLTIYESFVSSLELADFDYLDFEVVFGSGEYSYFSVAVVPSMNPYLYPSEADFDLSNPGDVHTNVVSVALPAEIMTVSVNDSPLTPDVDYVVNDRWLFIDESYLSTNLTAAGQQLTLTVSFAGGYETDLVITATETGITNATIDPDSAVYENEGPDSVDITITWNDATAVESLTVFVNSSWDVMEFEWPFYNVTDNGNGTATLTILFEGDEKLTYSNFSKLISNEKRDKESETDLITIKVNFDIGAPATFYITYIYNFTEVIVTISPPEAGWVSGDWTYQPGEEVWLAAYPNPGYIFREWQNAEGQTVSTANPYIFTMPDADVILTAIFELGSGELYNLSYEVVGDGVGNLSAFLLEGNFVPSGSQLPEGTVVQFFASPDFIYTVKEWTLNGEILDLGSPVPMFYMLPGLLEDVHITVEFIEFISPSVSPNPIFFSLETQDDLELDIIWGGETVINKIDYLFFDGNDLIPMPLEEGTDYTIIGDKLTILSEYILSLDPMIGNWYPFNIEFGTGWTAWFEVIVVGSLNPQIIPGTLTFEVNNPSDLLATVSYIEPITILSVLQNENPLTPEEDYRIVGPWLILNESFLVEVFPDADMEINLDVVTDAGTLLLVVNSVLTSVTNASIDPSELTYYNETPEFQDITITWNDATAVNSLGITVNFPGGQEFIDWPFYTVTDNGDGTATLRIDFMSEGKDASFFEKYKKLMEFTTYIDIEIEFDMGTSAHLLLTFVEVLYEVTVDNMPLEAGYVMGGGYYWLDEVVTVEAVPYFGYEFARWEIDGNVVSSNAVYTFKMPANDVHLTAIFEVEGTQLYTLTLVANPVEGGTLTGAGEYSVGDSITVSASGNEGYLFVNWTETGGNIISTESSFNFIMPAENKTLTANFAPEIVLHTVTFIVKDNGTPVENASVTINDAEVLTNADGEAIFTNVADGTHNYTITHDDYLDATDSFTMDGEDATINVNLITTSISETVSKVAKVFPNPFNDYLSLTSGTEISRITIANITGQIVLDQDVKSSSQTISTASLHKGVYMITLWLDNGNQVIKKIVKQ